MNNLLKKLDRTAERLLNVMDNHLQQPVVRATTFAAFDDNHVRSNGHIEEPLPHYEEPLTQQPGHKPSTAKTTAEYESCAACYAM